MSEDRIELSRVDYDKLINGTLDVLGQIGKVEAERDSLLRQVEALRLDLEAAKNDLSVLVQDINEATGVEYRDALDASLHLGNFIRNQKADMAVLKYQKEQARAEGAVAERAAVVAWLRWARTDLSAEDWPAGEQMLDAVAETIERGAHVRPVEDPF
jgi:hypothetical protein